MRTQILADSSPMLVEADQSGDLGRPPQQSDERFHRPEATIVCMTTDDAPVVVASYRARHRANLLAEELRKYKIGAAAIASASRPGAWDVVVRPDFAERANELVRSLQNL